MEGSGGPEGVRTPDLDTASVALSQLSYGPIGAASMGRGGRISVEAAPALGLDRPIDLADPPEAVSAPSLLAGEG